MQTDDIDAFRSHGRVFYRETTDPNILARATDDVLKYLAPTSSNRTFTATSAFIATWFRLTHYVFWRNDGNPVSTAELVSNSGSLQTHKVGNINIRAQNSNKMLPLVRIELGISATAYSDNLTVRASLNCPLSMHCSILGLAH